MASTPTTAPSRFVAGTTLTWNRTPDGEHADRTPAAGWALTVRLQGAITVVLAPVTGTGTAFAVTVPASTTAALPAGEYRIVEVLSSGSEVYVCAETMARVVAMPDAGADGRSFAVRMLEAVESVIAGRIPNDVESYSIGGRSISMMRMAELMELRTKLQYEVARERNKGALTGVGVQFTNSSRWPGAVYGR